MANVFNAHQIAAFGHYQQISSTHAIGHRNQIAAFEYCRDVANIPVALLNAAIPNIQNQQTNLANQLQNHQRREQVPGRATHNIEERKVSLEMDLSELREAMSEGRAYLKTYLMGQAHNPRYVQLFGVSQDNQVNRERARVNREINPFYLPNILEQMKWTANRPAHYSFMDGCHAYHYSVPPLRVGHDMATAPYDIINQIAINIDPMSYFTDTVNWAGAQHNFFGPGQNLSTVPVVADRITNEYRNWLPTMETFPGMPDIENRIHTNMWGVQVVNPTRRCFNWSKSKGIIISTAYGTHSVSSRETGKTCGPGATNHTIMIIKLLE